MLSNPSKRTTFFQIREGYKTMVILYYPKFYNFFTKRATGGFYDYYDIVPKEEI